MEGKVVRETLVITNDTKYLSTVRTFVTTMIQKSGLSRQDENKIVLAVDEAVTNIIEHGYEKDQSGTIEIEIESSAQSFIVSIRDEGKFFNPELAPDPDIMEHLKMGKKKGLGIFLMRQIMDEVKYRFKGGVKNELTLVKHIK